MFEQMFVAVVAELYYTKNTDLMIVFFDGHNRITKQVATYYINDDVKVTLSNDGECCTIFLGHSNSRTF